MSTVYVVVGTEPVPPKVDVAAAARARMTGVDVVVGDPVALGKLLAAGAVPTHILLDDRSLTEAERAAFRQVRPVIELHHILVSVVYGERLDDAAMRDMLLWESVDDVALLFGDGDARELLDSVAATLAATAVPVPTDAFRIGSLYEVGAHGYAAARRSSLFSNGLSGFVRDLMKVGRLFAGYPLATVLPWDPKDEQPAERAVRDVTGEWSLRLTGGDLPNLTQVLNAHKTPEAQRRLCMSSVDWFEARPERWAKDWVAAWGDAGASSPLVLLTGESGTGKSLAAETIADLLRTHQVPVKGRFMKVNCGALTDSTFTHLLMGTAPGYWSGVPEAAAGELVRAAHGVVFFDEIGDLPSDVQRGMLTYFDDRRLRPAGMSRFRGFQHVIAATNRDVDEGANQRWFRNDLLARFQVRVNIPPLRERTVAERRRLVDFIAQDPVVNPRRDKELLVTHIAAAVFAELAARDYRDGNFREMQETVHMALGQAASRRSRVVEPCDMPVQRPAHARSDRDSRRVRVTAVGLPAELPVVDVASEGDLRVLADRENRALLTDRDGMSWVLTSTATFRAPADRD